MKDSSMCQKCLLVALSLICLGTCARSALGQRGGAAGAASGQESTAASGQSPSTGQASGASGNTTLQGISFSRDSWRDQIGFLPPPKTFDMRSDNDVATIWDNLNADSF